MPPPVLSQDEARKNLLPKSQPHERGSLEDIRTPLIHGGEINASRTWYALLLASFTTFIAFIKNEFEEKTSVLRKGKNEPFSFLGTSNWGKALQILSPIALSVSWLHTLYVIKRLYQANN